MPNSGAPRPRPFEWEALEAQSGPRRPRDLAMCRWDPVCERSHALRGRAPTSDKLLRDQTVDALTAIRLGHRPSDRDPVAAPPAQADAAGQGPLGVEAPERPRDLGAQRRRAARGGVPCVNGCICDVGPGREEGCGPVPRKRPKPEAVAAKLGAGWWSAPRTARLGAERGAPGALPVRRRGPLFGPRLASPPRAGSRPPSHRARARARGRGAPGGAPRRWRPIAGPSGPAAIARPGPSGAAGAARDAAPRRRTRRAPRRPPPAPGSSRRCAASRAPARSDARARALHGHVEPSDRKGAVQSVCPSVVPEGRPGRGAGRGPAERWAVAGRGRVGCAVGKGGGDRSARRPPWVRPGA